MNLISNQWYTRVKLFSNLTRQRLITQTYFPCNCKVKRSIETSPGQYYFLENSKKKIGRQNITHQRLVLVLFFQTDSTFPLLQRGKFRQP